jgi:RimJ/RimL family protein N-acetyltransferase
MSCDCNRLGTLSWPRPIGAALETEIHVNVLTELHIRPAEDKDAEALIAYMHRLTSEPHNNITLDPGQWTMTVEEERAFLAKRNVDPNKGIFAVATVGHELVGIGQLDRGAKPTIRHAATLGISVDAAWRRRGIATALMTYLLTWAREHDLVRIELKVLTRNAGAIQLYRKFGFAEEGRHPKACCKQGVWVDDLTMGLILPPT